VKASGFTPVE